MIKTKLIDLLRKGEILYLNDQKSLLSFFPVKPGTKDDYTNYIFLDQKTGFFFEFDKETQKTRHISIHSVQNIVKDLEREQEKVTQFLQKTN